MEQSLPTIHMVFRLMALSQVLLLVSYLLVYERHRTGGLMALTAASFCCYLVMPFVWNTPFSSTFLDFFASSIPALVWLLARLFFVDSKSIPVWFWVFWMGYMVLWLPDFRNVHAWGTAGEVLFGLLPQLIKLGFVAHAILMALMGRRNDLVSQRLKLRVPIAVGAGVLTSIVILVEIWAGGRTLPVIDAGGSAIFFIVCLTSNLYLFTMRGEFATMFSSSVSTRTPDEIKAEDNTGVVQEIEKRVVEERFCANHGATIGDLSSLVGIPEYKLRLMINQGLGYRNFNQFLNHYRISEASDRLVTEWTVPILTIALDVGFKSLSSFNKFFRETHGCTPTEYRNTEKSS